MGRFLFVVPPLTGHVNPLVGVAGALGARGHEVAWAGVGEIVRSLAGAGAPVYECAMPEGGLSRTADLRGPGALQFLWEDFLIPLADRMATGVHEAIGEFRPDVVVADQQTVAGGLVAEALGARWITSATTSAELADPFRELPKVAAWLETLLHELRGRIAGGRGSADPRMSPHGVLAFTTRELLGPHPLPDNVWLVGPSIAARPSSSDFPWEWLATTARTVLVTLGTANLDASARFLAAAAEGLAGMPVRAVVADPGGVLGEVGENVLVRSHVPQLPLLERVDAVVCHGGHNTVAESLWHGVPMVVAPIRDDQPIVAGQVVAAGAGVRVRFGRSGPAKIAAAVDEVLTGDGYRRAAERVGRSFRAAGGSAAAAARLEAALPQPAAGSASRR
ncbi:glycosyltransferase [Amycolatopsis minnesotensis]|uniref:Glycosyltransferase n=1 Tax=Amycolatopsis minnesotensis TaxID=337894 RepID=A0ABP5CJL7_9PSEU